MKTVIVYGIPNCDTVKKATNWLTKNKISFQFQDYKKQGIEKEKLEGWCSKVSWEILLNKKSTTWRELSKPEQEQVINKAAGIKVMMSNTSIIKRPVIENDNKIIVGFNEEGYKQFFNEK
jgi:arsenate reductase (glutaredoxin)